MSTEATYPKDHFLSGGWDLQSWLLTKDHKRIGILYLVSISAMFVLGGLYAGLIRWNLLVPDGSHMSADTYNKTFTAHGVIMVFFFLIPSIPAVLGNFLIPLMIGAKDLAFPKLNLLSWYLYVLGGGDHALRAPRGRARHRLDLLHALQHGLRAEQRRDRRDRHLRRRLLLDPHRAQLHRHHPQDAGPGHDLVPDAALRVGPLRDRDHPGPRHAGGRDHDPAGGPRARSSTSASSTPPAAATRSSSSTSSGSTRTPPSTS